MPRLGLFSGCPVGLCVLVRAQLDYTAVRPDIGDTAASNIPVC